MTTIGTRTPIGISASMGATTAITNTSRIGWFSLLSCVESEAQADEHQPRGLMEPAVGGRVRIVTNLRKRRTHGERREDGCTEYSDFAAQLLVDQRFEAVAVD